MAICVAIAQLPRHRSAATPPAWLIPVISDTCPPRGERRLPDACVQRLKAADLIIHAGDLSTIAAVIHDAGLRPGRTERLRRRCPAADAVVFGQSNMPQHERAPDGFQIFDPGSPTERRRAPHHMMGLARVTGGELRFGLVSLD